MFWQEGDDDKLHRIPDDIQDVVFRLQGKTLPVDYAHLLAEALRAAAPWLAEDESVGIYLQTTLEEGNGWAKPSAADATLYLSRRAQLVLRLPKAYLPKAQALEAVQLEIDGHTLVLGTAKSKPLSDITTLYARHIIDEAEDEAAFLQGMLAELQALQIGCKKMLCGKSRQLQCGEAVLHTRSLMLADLNREEAVRLQQRGVGRHRHLGCGIFVPHKAIG